MPKLRQSAEEERARILLAKIKYGMEKQGVTHEQLAFAAHITRPTLYARYRCPDEFKLCELRRISTKLKLPLQFLLNDKDITEENVKRVVTDSVAS